MREFTRDNASNKENRRRIILYSALLFAGLLFLFLILKNLAQDLAPYFWKKTPCKTLRAEIVKTDENSLHYVFKVEYDYRFEGRSFRNSRWRQSTVEPFDSYSALADRTGRFLMPWEHFCYVNADHPNQSVLQRENPAKILLILFPLMMIAPAVSRLRKIRNPDSTRSSKVKMVPIAKLVALALCSFGIFLFVIFFVLAIFELIRATGWEKNTCTVISSYLLTDQSTTSHNVRSTRGYRLRVLFSYVYRGQEFQGDRYNFVRWGSGGSTLNEILSQYPADAKVECYVNSDKPYQAVLNRRLTWRYFMGLLPLLFTGAGWILYLVTSRM